MTTGIKVAAGTDLDDVFDPYTIGTKPANTGTATSDGVDLANRYAPLSYGSAAAATGFKIASGADFNTLWAAKGSATYTIANLNGRNFNVIQTALSSSGNVSARIDVTIVNSGGWTAAASDSTGTRAMPGTNSGTWLPAGGAVADYQVQIDTTVTENTGGSVANGASVYADCTTSRAVSAILPSFPASNTTQRSVGVSVRIRIRHKTTLQVISDSSFTMTAETNGFS